MFSTKAANTFCVNRWPLGLLLLSVVAAGCSGGSQSADLALNKAITATGGTKGGVAKFSGKVTIDGKPPGEMGRVRTLVILWDPKSTKGNKMPPYVACSEDGHFEFTSYETGDGVMPGNYIVCFLQLPGSFRFGGTSGWHGEDGLKNLYNDPDKNKENKEFVVDVALPGKTDWQFNLDVANKEAGTPGPNAITQLK
jgi:hypothetical protein